VNGANDPGAVPGRTLRDWLAEGPFTLTMSSGFFGFFAHAGVLSVLEEVGCTPSWASGSSAGALVAAAHASGLSAGALIEVLSGLEREHFWDPGPLYGVTQGGLLRGELLREKVEALLPVRTFEACRIPLAVSAFDVLSRRTEVLARGELASAVVASCAVPVLFRPVRRDGRLLLDGGIRDRPGLAGAPRGSRVLFHHLASRSPWRRAKELRVPRRDGLVALVLDGLPRSGPRDLASGRLAMKRAREAALRALERRVEHDTVRLEA
jgi:NTE family protein